MPEPETPEHISIQQAILRELHGISFLLDDRNDHADFNAAAVVATNEGRAVREMLDWPIRGGRRYVVPRPGNGGQVIGTNGFSVLLPANAARIGGLISVQGATAILYLGTVQEAMSGKALPQITLPAGAQWNMKLSDVVWGGDISFFATVAAQISVAEV
jgi:hypothetical protein